MRIHIDVIFLLWTAVSVACLPNGRATAAESGEWPVSGEDAHDFLLGMIPPTHRGDWAAFNRYGRRIVATIIEAEGVGADRRLVIAVREHTADGREIDGGKQEVILSEAMRAMADSHDRFVISRRTVTVKGKPIAAASIKAFSGGQLNNEITISSEVPLGEVVRHYSDGEATLVDFGWGDETYRPEEARLTYRQAADRVGDALPAPSEGEWCEYALSGWDADIIEKYHVTQGRNGRADGGNLVSVYGVDENGWFHSFQRDTVAGIQNQYGEDFFDRPPYYTVSRESVSVKDGKKNGLSMKFYMDGIFIGRFDFSGDIPFPWLVSALFLPSDGGKRLRLTDYGREESREVVDREARATVDDAVTEVVDKALRKAAVGDWALFEVMGTGKVRYELVEIERDGQWTRYEELIRVFDNAGNIIREDRKSNTPGEFVNGFILGGDVRSDRFELARGETTVNGVALPILSLTGYEEGRRRYRFDLSADVPAVAFVNMVIFDLSDQPLYRLIDYGRAGDPPAGE